MTELTIEEAARKLGVTTTQLDAVVNGKKGRSSASRRRPGAARHDSRWLNPNWRLNRDGYWTDGRATIWIDDATRAAVDRTYERWCRERGQEPRRRGEAV
ncbi:hypothetical protein [Patulibacter sp. SYSU D01012]|uniref:hypothetical protein n=1 Tax=Patulibacter sp. SYSU D01012 TaxID=2817381 RepID=UPI001B30653E|nr:hypothetical protein [Patulibacter sp. SYSU D01012]